jgi:hypothetical protein
MTLSSGISNREAWQPSERGAKSFSFEQEQRRYVELGQR